jgi:hypothetical protein
MILLKSIEKKGCIHLPIPSMHFNAFFIIWKPLKDEIQYIKIHVFKRDESHSNAKFNKLCH